MKTSTIITWVIIAAVMSWAVSSGHYMRKELIGQQQLLSRTIKEVSLNQHIATIAVKACERRGNINGSIKTVSKVNTVYID